MMDEGLGEAAEENRESFVLIAGFEQGELLPGLGLGPLEREYQEIFARALDDGVITTSERARLDLAASNLGLSAERLARLEEAMTMAYETHHRVRVVNLSLGGQASLAPLANAPPLGSATDLTVENQLSSLQCENLELRQRIQDLETELERVQSMVNIEVDLSLLEEDAVGALDPQSAWKRVRQDATDPEALRVLARAYRDHGQLDGEYLVAQALCALGEANEAESALFELHRPKTLIAPRSSIDPSVWMRDIAHADDDPVVGALFAVIVPALLVGKVTSLRRDAQLHVPQENTRQDPQKSTVMAARALGWAAQLACLPVPAVFAEPGRETGYAHVVGLPPITVIGKQALSGKSIADLAFLVGQHISGYRGEHYVKTLYRGTEDLEDLFLAALTLANPQLPLVGAQRARVEPLARAIEPLLEPPAIDALRSHYSRFAEEGGRTNLQRWAQAVDKTAARAGLALCQDLPAALSQLDLHEGRLGPLALDLLSYSTSSRFLHLRSTLGISLSTE